MQRIVIRNIVGALAILATSYLVSAFINAAPITQPLLTSAYPRSGAVVFVPTAPVPDPDSRALPVESPTADDRQLKAL